MRKFVTRSLRGLFVASPLALLLAMSASAAPSGDREVPAKVREALARDLALSPAQLAHYLQVERKAMQSVDRLARLEGERFAGSWIERGPRGDFRVVVASTQPAAKVRERGIELRRVRHDLASLQASKQAIDEVVDRGLGAPRGVYGWHVDLRSNSVTVNVAPGAQAAAIELVAHSLADAQTIRFQTMASQPRPLATLMGGSEYLSNDGSNYYYCSVGFAVTRNGAQGFATAGHCGNAGDRAFVAVNRRTVSQIGAFAASNFPGSDRAWVQVDNNHSLQPVVDGYNGSDIPVYGSLEAPVGAAVCRSGRTTGLHCGVIETKNVTVQYPGESVNGLTQVKVCAEGGDSGGAFITGAGQGQGVLSGGNYSCKGKQAKLATSYFQPLIPLLQSYSLSLKTSP